VRTATLLVPTIFMMLGGCGAGSKADSLPPDDSSVADTVIGIVTDGLERLRLGDPTGITNACTDDVTYYSVEFDSLLVGRQALVDMYGPPTGQTSFDHFDLINPTVRVYGDVAVLAFDFASYTTADDSQLRTRWRSTQVLARVHPGWRIVHIHWTLLENRLGLLELDATFPQGLGFVSSDTRLWATLDRRPRSHSPPDATTESTFVTRLAGTIVATSWSRLVPGTRRPPDGPPPSNGRDSPGRPRPPDLRSTDSRRTASGET